MCHFVAVGIVPGSREKIDLPSLWPLRPAPDYIQAAFPPGQEACILDVGHCACGFFNDPMDEREEQRIRARGKKKRWTATKIDRAVESRSQTGGLDQGILHRVIAAADSGVLSLLVFWDDNKTTPSEPPISVPPSRLIEQRTSVRAGRLVLLS